MITLISFYCIVHLLSSNEDANAVRSFLWTLQLRVHKVLRLKCCYNNIIVPSGHSRQPPVFGNDFPVWRLETTSWKWMRESCQRLRQLLEVAVTAGSRGGSLAMFVIWQKMLISILIVIFPHNSNKLRPQTESCIFWCGIIILDMLSHSGQLFRVYLLCFVWA